MSGAIQNDQDILEVSRETVRELKRRTLASPRCRFRLCMHRSSQDRTHEMVIVFRKGTFMPPHRHPEGKSESYHIIEGSMTVYFFDNHGNVVKTIDMGQASGSGAFLYRLSCSRWHMPVATSEWLVYHETYSGPFDKGSDVEFPAWAPKEDDKELVARFLSACRMARDGLDGVGPRSYRNPKRRAKGSPRRIR